MQRSGCRRFHAASCWTSPLPRRSSSFWALGLPVVCNDNPEQERIIKACGAGRCVPYTAASFADAVDELLRLPPTTREEMSRAGRQYVAMHRDYTVLAANLARDLQVPHRDQWVAGWTLSRLANNMLRRVARKLRLAMDRSGSGAPPQAGAVHTRSVLHIRRLSENRLDRRRANSGGRRIPRERIRVGRFFAAKNA